MMRRLLLSLIAFYRRWISPATGTRCRFEPTCARYAEEAIILHGVIVGSLLTVARLLRCHPLCRGGHDPVPEERFVWPGRRSSG